MQNKPKPWTTVLTIIITAIVVGGGVYYWQTQSLTEKVAPEEMELTEPKFRSLLYEEEYYTLPFGAAEIEGYYTTVEQPLGLGDDVDTVTCSAFVVTNGPSLLLDSFEKDTYMSRHAGTPPTVVIGSEDSSWGNISSSTEENPITVLVTLNSRFEGEIIGCMSWPFDSILEIE